MNETLDLSRQAREDVESVGTGEVILAAVGRDTGHKQTVAPQTDRDGVVAVSHRP